MQIHIAVQRVLLVCLGVAACDGAAARPRYINRADWQAPRVCTSLALGELGEVADITTVSDSSFAVLLGDERKLVVFDARFRQVDSVQFDRDGPRGLLRPVSIAVTDSMLFVADDARSSIRYFTAGGVDRGTLRLQFIPRRVRIAGGRLIVTPLVAGGSPAHLAFEIRGRQAAPLGGGIARYDDVGINTLANMTSVAAFADRVVIMHEMVVPFGYVMRPGQSPDLAQRFAVPVPADLKDGLGRVPREPLNDRNVNRLAVVAFAAAGVPATRSVYYVTRTDASRGRFQKLLVRLDSLFNVAAVFPIRVNPHHMTYLPARSSLIVVDADSDWHECRVS